MPGVRARVVVAVTVGVLVTLTPLVNDFCARSCDRPTDASCPLHTPRPEPQCAHDHSVMSADLPRTHHASDPQGSQPAALAVALQPAGEPVTRGSASTSPQQFPRRSVTTLLALRI